MKAMAMTRNQRHRGMRRNNETTAKQIKAAMKARMTAQRTGVKWQRRVGRDMKKLGDIASSSTLIFRCCRCALGASRLMRSLNSSCSRSHAQA